MLSSVRHQPSDHHTTSASKESSCNTTDYIDLFQIHRPDPDTDVEETLSALTDLVRAGKVRAIGSPAMPASQIVEAQWIAEQAGMPLTHLAIAFVIAHPGVTAELVGPRTMAHLDDLLAGMDVALSDDILDRIDEIVPPGTDVGVSDGAAYVPQALTTPGLRRRPFDVRTAA